jgi:hypothetical protein
MLEFLRDSIWQFIGAIFGIIAILISLVIFFLQRSKKSLAYEVVTSSPLFTAKEEIKEDLEVYFKKKLVKDVQLIILKVKNDGNQPILKTDFDEPLKFIFDNNSEVLTAEIISKTESLTIALLVNNNEITINPSLLNSGDFFEIKVVNSQESDVKCEGRVVGIEKIRKNTESSKKGFFSELRYNVTKIGLLIMFILLGVSIVGMAVDFLNSDDFTLIFNGNSPAGRQATVNNYNDNERQKGNNKTFFEVIDDENRTLLVRSSSMTEFDCELIIKTKSAKTLKNRGFNKVICKNEDKKEQWSFPLN